MTRSCRACGRTYDSGADEPWRCACGHALDFAERPLPDGPPPDPAALDRDAGIRAFEAFLPVEPVITLGEGWTPLVDASAAHRVAERRAGDARETPDWNAAFKLEYLFPSGSFKDRGAATTLSRAAALGVERAVEDSSGNAGAAIAQYAARAGIEAAIYVPADARPSKLRAIEAAGAEVVRVEGSRQDVTDACVDAVSSGEGWYASHAWNSAFLAGTATFALELAAQRDWRVPDAVVTPLGHGTLLLGAYRGFRALRDAGWTDRLPRLVGVQAAGTAPVVEALGGDDSTDDAVGEDAAGDDAAGGGNDVADGIQIARPAREAQVIDAIRDSGGDAIAVGADETREALAALHRAGFYVEPTSAAGVAGLVACRERGILDADADVVVPLTGSGLKT